MAADYRPTEDKSNLIIIDKKGIIRYYACGKIEEPQIEQIKDLLRLLTQ